jgi:malate permease and related proteins
MITLAQILAPIFIVAGLGFTWDRLGHRFETDFVTRLVTMVGTPALVFSALTSHGLSLASFGVTALAAVLAVTAFGAIGAAVLRLARLPVRSSYLSTLMLPNAGNMGLPIALFAFGEPGLALAIAFSTVITIAHFTVGLSLASGTTSSRHLLTAPALYAMLGALGFIAGGVAPPVWLANTTELLGGLTIPMMLLSLGVSLSRLHVAALGRSTLLGLARLGMGFAVGVGLARLFGLDQVAAGVVILQCSMPAAVLNYLWAARYGGPVEDVAGTIILSTLLSFVTLPLLLWYVL